MINVNKVLGEISDYFSPSVIGEIEDMYVKVAKIKGDDIPWHSHENEDELFYIIKGELLMEIESKEAFVMREGDMQVIKKKVRHKVSAQEECSILLIERKSTLHTGGVESDITRTIEEQLRTNI